MEEWVAGKSFLFYSSAVKLEIRSPARFGRKGDERAGRRCEPSVEKLSSDSAKDAIFYKALHFIRGKNATVAVCSGFMEDLVVRTHLFSKINGTVQTSLSLGYSC